MVNVLLNCIHLIEMNFELIIFFDVINGNPGNLVIIYQGEILTTQQKTTKQLSASDVVAFFLNAWNAWNAGMPECTAE